MTIAKAMTFLSAVLLFSNFSYGFSDQPDHSCQIWAFYGGFYADHYTRKPILNAEGVGTFSLLIRMPRGSIAAGKTAGLLYRSDEYPNWKTAYPNQCVHGIENGYPSDRDQCHFELSSQTMSPLGHSFEFIPFVVDGDKRFFDHNGERNGLNENHTLKSLGERYEFYSCDR